MLYLLCLITIVVSFARLVYLFTKMRKRRICLCNENQIKLMAIAGSGGHTTELIRLLAELPEAFSPRHYVVATSDSMSENKLIKLEMTRKFDKNSYSLHKIPRSREVAQSWLSTVYTTLIASLYALPLMWKCKPDLVLCNGPGTCIPICAIGLLFKFLGICWTEIVYVESLCRVKTMSMSGKILYPFADQFYIQWPYLLEKYPKAKYLGGRIV